MMMGMGSIGFLLIATGVYFLFHWLSGDMEREQEEHNRRYADILNPKDKSDKTGS